MGVGGGFWDELRAVVRNKGLEWLHGKRLAIDLSYWVVQNQSAVGAIVHKPHLRLLFFRLVNLISRTRVFPVFVVDGHPPPEKLEVRLERFSRKTGSPVTLPSSQGAYTKDSYSVRNSAFQESIDECVELLELLGMPVLQAAGEAEALCAELDREGWADACVTPDSDAFLHGAKCVIKALQVDSKVPLIETYAAEDIKTILGLDREHMIALALLVGCDYDKKGVSGIGCSHAIRLVQSVSSDKLFERLREWGRGEHKPINILNDEDGLSESDEEQDDEGNEARRRLSFGELSNTTGDRRRSPLHCTNCGHPGTKREHTLSMCAICRNGEEVGDATHLGCVKKGKGFQCKCWFCAKKRKLNMKTKETDWWVKYCNKMSSTDGFPNENIMNIFLRPGFSNFAGTGSPASLIKWRSPNMELLEDFMQLHLHWDATYVRQRTLPLLSTICLQGLAARNQLQPKIWNDYPFENSLIGRYIPHSIQRIKVDKSKEYYLLQWMSLAGFKGDKDWLGLSTSKQRAFPFTQNARGGPVGVEDQEAFDVDGDATLIQSEHGNSKVEFSTMEDMKLVEAACPELVEAFEQEQAVKEMAKATKKGSKRKTSEQDGQPCQRSIKAFFKVRKGPGMEPPTMKVLSDDSASPESLLTRSLGKDGQSTSSAEALRMDEDQFLRRTLFP